MRPAWPACRCAAGVHECHNSKVGECGGLACVHCNKCGMHVRRYWPVDAEVGRRKKDKAKHLALRRVHPDDIGCVF